ncbi:MAG: hypothetical protein M3Y53_08605 [Thermoproteota archaeon]|nr:hypothetical protein [Thermoproteota archaeon]
MDSSTEISRARPTTRVSISRDYTIIVYSRALEDILARIKSIELISIDHIINRILTLLPTNHQVVIIRGVLATFVAVARHIGGMTRILALLK